MTLPAGLARILPMLATLALLVAAITVVSPGFLDISVANGRLYGSPIDVLNRGAPVALLAIGMTLVIATGGIDLSVGAVMAICGAVAAKMVTLGYPLPVTLLAALATGAACGLWNGLLVSVLRIQPIIATLILMVAGRGIAQLVTEGAILTFSDPGLAFLGSGAVLGVPFPVLLWTAAAVGTILVLRRTALGFLIEAVGVNARAAYRAGVNTRVTIIAVYVVSGLCAALAGLVVTADIRGADANNAGLWLELDAILAVVIGGNSLLGGRFSVVASLIGAMITQTVNTGILLAGFPPEYNLLIKAWIVLVIVVVQSPRLRPLLARRRAMRRGTPT